MGEQRAFGVKPSSLHHHANAVDGQLFESVPLLWLDLSREPHEVLVLAELLFDFLASDMQDWRKRSGSIRGTVERRGDTEYGRHLHVHCQHLPVPVGHGSS